MTSNRSMLDRFEAALLDDPLNYESFSFDLGFQLSSAALQAIHLAGLRKRFLNLRDRVGTLNRAAMQAGLSTISSVEDAARLLLPHTAYKSYPAAYVQSRRFDVMTGWLSNLTATDLSKVDARAVASVDEWLDVTSQNSELAVVHTSGTTGKLSFVPRTKEQCRHSARLVANWLRDWHGAGTGPDLLRDHMPVIQPTYRFGATAFLRGADLMVELFAGGETNALFLHPKGRLSADVLASAAAVPGASIHEPRGEQTAVQDQYAIPTQATPGSPATQRFLSEMLGRFRGRDVLLFVLWPILYEWSKTGLAFGLHSVFGPRSILITGGGNKAAMLPKNFKETVFQFLGFSQYFEIYGMSEMIPVCPKCEAGNYHIPPNVVPYVLGPDTGKLLPRDGRQTGRFGFVDLCADNYWGGFITGDEVNLVGYDQPCSCGRSGFYIEQPIVRYREKLDDKISCAELGDVHDRAAKQMTGEL